MKKFNSLFLTLTTAMVLAVSVFFTSCNKGDDDDDTTIPTTKEYIGADACKSCHADQYNLWIKSGHPYKVNKVVNAQPPTYPYTSVPNPPAGYTWNDITYVIGGATKKARFMDNKGYIMTGEGMQYNLATKEWVAYDATIPNHTKPYDCGRCHVTGWVSTDDGGGHQDGLEGIMGTWFSSKVSCERCHDKGNIHAATQKKEDIVVDESAELCGECHYRNSDHTIAAKGGYIKHHEQYDEMMSAGHKVLTCVSCHDPHGTVLNGHYDGLIKQCTDCHTEPVYANFKHNGAKCVDCHMPKASKSALAVNKYTGDVATHIFKINTDPNGKMFSDDGSLANPDGAGVTLEYVCYTCHNDPDGIGGGGSTKTLTELAAKAATFHK